MRLDDVGLRQPLATKVPEITVLFWATKVATTGMGEAASDWLGTTSLVLGAVVGVGGFAAAMWLQLRSRRYHAPTYWAAVSMLAVFGTILADVLHRGTDLSYAVTTPLCALGVAAALLVWHRVEGTVSIHTITTRRRELFYWTTVAATFALGTAAGDLVGLTLHLGFAPAGLLFAAAMVVPLVAWRLEVDPVLTFWAAYVLTRPLGASFADWLGKPASIGDGVGLGDGPVALVGIATIVVLVAVTTQAGAQGSLSRGGRTSVRDHPPTRERAPG